MARFFFVTSISNEVRTVRYSVVDVPSAVEVDDVSSVARTFSAGTPSLPVSASVSGDRAATMVSVVVLLIDRWVRSGVVVNHDLTKSLLKKSGEEWLNNVLLLLHKLVEMQQVQFSSEKERATRVLPLLDELQRMLQSLEEEDFAPFKEVVLHDLAPIVEEIRSLV